jgi:hypothetical protein
MFLLGVCSFLMFVLVTVHSRMGCETVLGAWAT